MFPFDPPKDIKKPKVFWCFQGDQKGTLVRKGLRSSEYLDESNCKQVIFFQGIFKVFTWADMFRISLNGGFFVLASRGVFLAIFQSKFCSHSKDDDDDDDDDELFLKNDWLTKGVKPYLLDYKPSVFWWFHGGWKLIISLKFA